MRKLACIAFLLSGCPAPTPFSEPPPVVTPEQQPPRPRIGKQLDRVGRPLVTAALVSDHAAYDAATPDQWSSFTAEIAQSVALFDSLDGICGNLVLAGTGTATYTQLAGVLADDRLWVNTDETTCGDYLAVEAGRSGNCGGRIVGDDVIDQLYSQLSSNGTAKLGDGVDTDDDSFGGNPINFLL